MAVQAAAGNYPVFPGCGRAGKCFKPGVNCSGMSSGVVATLTQQWRFRRQKLSMIAAVRHMASKTIFGNRRMFPHIRPALFGMTLETEFIYGIRPHHLRTRSAVRVMTLGAFHQAFLKRMMRLFIGLGSNRGVTGDSKAPVRSFLNCFSFRSARCDNHCMKLR